MTNFTRIWLMVFTCCFMYSGITIHGFLYDYSATINCIIEPLKPHYDGGIIYNPELNQGIDGWTAFGQSKIEDRISEGGNRFIVAHSRTESLDSISQKIQLENGHIYSFSAFIQISEGSEAVSVLFRTSRGELIHGGLVIAKHGCWSMLKGGIVSNFSGPAEILFECANTSVEVWVDNISLQPFTRDQWSLHQDISIEKVRKEKVKFQVTYSNKSAADSYRIYVKQTKPGFPFGCGINDYILKSKDYQNWFTSRFHVTTFTNQMKWYSTESVRGHEDYSVADAMVKFAKKNGISVRGHNVIWDDPSKQPSWVKNLSRDELLKEAEERINSIVARYKGQLIAWDVVNENLHFSYYEDRLGENISEVFYAKAYQLDPKTTMFMNEYNTIEYSKEEKASPQNYIKKLRKIMSFPGTAGIKLAIGLEGHFPAAIPNIAHMRSALDILATTRLPIWLTEVSINQCPNQAKYLEDILREAYAHPAVKGIISFSGPEPAGFRETTLTDMNFKNTPAGDVVDKLIKEWKSRTQEIIVDNGGLLEISLFHGDYNVTVEHPESKSSTTASFKVTKDTSQGTFNIQLHV